jgi:hypothetical protein
VLQVGHSVRIKNNRDLVVDHSERELIGEGKAARAALMCGFDSEAGEHVIRLAEPVASHPHMQVHHRNDYSRAQPGRGCVAIEKGVLDESVR